MRKTALDRELDRQARIEIEEDRIRQREDIKARANFWKGVKNSFMFYVYAATAAVGVGAAFLLAIHPINLFTVICIAYTILQAWEIALYYMNKKGAA
jgi:hypothetical protein